MAFGQFKVHAGDFKTGDGRQWVGGKLLMKVDGKLLRETVPAAQIESVEAASEESVCKLKDGRKFLATAPAKVFTELTAVLF